MTQPPQDQQSAVQPILDKTIRWLETQLATNPEKEPVEAHVYAIQALRLASRDVTLHTKTLLEKIKQDLTFKIGVLIDLPRKHPEAFLELYGLALEHDPELAKELRNTVVEDIRKLQLQDGSIIGEHAELAQILYNLAPKDPSSLAALKHTSKLFEQKILKNLEGYTPAQLYVYVKSLLQAQLIDERSSNTVMDSVIVKQREDGGWGSPLDTLYSIRLLTAINTLVASERIRSGLHHLQSRLGEDGSLYDLKTTAIYVVASYEYMAAGSLDQLFESSGILANSSTYSLKSLLAAAIRRAHTTLTTVDLKSTQLVEALLSALETNPTLEATLLYSGDTQTVPQTLKQPNPRLKLRLIQPGAQPLIVVDRRLIVFAPLGDEALSDPRAFAVKILDPNLAEKLDVLLGKLSEAA